VRGRRVLPVAIAALLALVVAAAPAAARRDDKPTELYHPGNGAVVKDASHGLNVDFTCPTYHQFTYDELITAPTAGYHVILSTNNLVDENRLLVPAGRVDVRDGVSIDGLDGHCTAAPDAADDGLMPTEPGLYYWQSYRECATYVCPGGVEVSDVWAVTVRRTGCSVDRVLLAQARRDLKTARAALHRRRTAGRRARVARLTARVTTLGERLRVVRGCKA
jgi:hypothetical protein